MGIKVTAGMRSKILVTFEETASLGGDISAKKDKNETDVQTLEN